MGKTARKIEIFDTTLRDGAQTEDISFSVEDKLRIAESWMNLVSTTLKEAGPVPILRI